MAEETDLAPLVATARRALLDWALDVDSVTLVSRSENVVFKVVTRDGKPYALRIHRPGYNSLNELNSELQWTESLNAAGIATPGHVRTRSGAGYATVPHDGTGQIHHVGLINWLDGVSLAELIETAGENDVVSYFEQIGAVLARIHDHAVGWKAPERFERRSWNADGLVGAEPLWGRFWEAPQLDEAQRQLLRLTTKTVHGVLKDLGESPSIYSLTHADLHPHNLLVDQGKVQIIDFDDSGFGWHHYEIAVALYQYRTQDRYPALREALLRGYQRIRPLDRSVIELLDMFFLIRSLVTLGWINDRPEHAEIEWIRRHVVTVCEESSAFLAG